MPDLTIIFYTALETPQNFSSRVASQLYKASEGIPIVTVIKPSDVPRSQKQIYLQALEGAYQAKTKYIACVEDDVLYSPEHFKFRPKDGHWGYNMNSWSIFTWGEPIFTQKPSGRRNLNGLICERQMFINYNEERFKLFPGEVDKSIFGEPGKYDKNLGIKQNCYPSEAFYTNPPNIVFSHQTNLQFEGLGTRKKIGEIRALEIPYWGTAKSIVDLYS